MAVLGQSALEAEVSGAIASAGSGAGGPGGKKKGKSGKGTAGGPSDLFRLIKMIMQRKLDPCIVFSFSKSDCEQYAVQLTQFDFTTEEEKKVSTATVRRLPSVRPVDSLGWHPLSTLTRC